jgi:hypothetical protein
MFMLIKINEQLRIWNGIIGKYFKVLRFYKVVGRQIFKSAVTSLNMGYKIRRVYQEE